MDHKSEHLLANLDAIISLATRQGVVRMIPCTRTCRTVPNKAARVAKHWWLCTT